MIRLLLQREPPIGDGIPGKLAVDGAFECYTLERRSKAIPAGQYPIELTVSQRATNGLLWSPDRETHQLPLLCNVPDRSGIRIHSANEPSQLEGCIAVGQVQNEDRVWQSQAAMTWLWKKLVARPNESILIDIRDAGTLTSRV